MKGQIWNYTMKKRKRKITIKKKNTQRHSIVLYATENAWNTFNELIEKENIPTVTAAFRILMINAIKSGQIKN